MQNLKSLVAAWRSSVEASGDLTPSQSAELEAHLLDAVDQLKAAGLASDEAFLIAVRRLGETDVLSAEFAKAYPHQRAHRMILWMLTGAFRGLGAPKCRQLERPVVRRRTAQCWSVEVAIDEQAYRDSGMLQWESGRPNLCDRAMPGLHSGAMDRSSNGYGHQFAHPFTPPHVNGNRCFFRIRFV